MKITVSENKIIMSNDTSIFNYFGWPTVARLKNGKLAVVASLYGRHRLRHLGRYDPMQHPKNNQRAHHGSRHRAE